MFKPHKSVTESPCPLCNISDSSWPVETITSDLRAKRIFRLLLVLHTLGFAVFPNGGIIADEAGNLYGTTQVDGGHASGTVFELVK